MERKLKLLKSFCRAFTSSYRNIGLDSTQRNESFGHLVKATLNPQLPLEEYLRRLQEQPATVSRNLAEDEKRSRTHIGCIHDAVALCLRNDEVKHYALALIHPEWAAAKENIINSGPNSELT